MNEINLFEYASRNKLTFTTSRGNLSADDLWDLSQENLNTLYKSLMKIQRETDTDTLLDQDNDNFALYAKIEIVKHIFNVKQEEAEARKQAASKKAQKARLLEIAARKQDAAYENMSMEELSKLIDEL